MNDDLTKGIRTLNQLAKKLRAIRIKNGALTLASPEVRFKLENDSQDPVDVGTFSKRLKSRIEGA